MNLARYFRQFWPFDDARAAVIAGYQRLARDKLLLADIGLRGGVWTGGRPGLSVFDAGVQEGRRQLAIEIWRCCRADPADLFGHVPKKPREGAPNHG